MAKEVPDDVAHLFAAVGRHDQIVGAIETRFGGLADALTLRGDGVGDAPSAARPRAGHPPRPASLSRSGRVTGLPPTIA